MTTKMEPQANRNQPLASAQRMIAILGESQLDLGTTAWRSGRGTRRSGGS